MKKCLILVVAVVFFASWAEAGGDPQATAKAFGAGKPVVVRENIKTLTATVVAIDHAKRLVSLKGPKGNVVELKVGEEVRNLPQVSVGDHVQVRFYESIAAQLAKPGTPLGATLQEAAGRAKPGDMPAGAAARQVTVVALIEKIDKRSQTVTLKGPEGGTTDVKVARPQMLEKVKVGDEVAVTYTEALAISVEKAVKK
ncbi:MAG: hypothetical protein EHM37_04805 [Deltaproteobacteria bacterium]|nr:MAG: hypothetical protein EHM37_04805 [Deltaproteobacteria bacterium]